MPNIFAAFRKSKPPPASESPKQPEPKRSVYRSLDPSRSQIRVIHVKAANHDSDALDCILHVVSLNSRPAPQYEAISYCWSQVQGTESLRLNGVMVNAPASAVDALRRFRGKTATRALWIDALCINQADVKERSSQVALMQRIYRQTSLCLIWLGRGDPENGPVLEAIQWVSQNLLDDSCNEMREIIQSWTTDHTAELFGDIDGGDLVEAFTLPWFRRVWVLQEAILAPRALCHFDEFELELRDVCRTATWIKRKTEVDRESFLAIGVTSATFLWQAVTMSSGIGSNGQGVRISDVTSLTTSLEASNEKDRFYGILGLLNPPLDSPSSKLKWLEIDYNRSVSQIYRDASRAAIIQDGDLGIFEKIDHTPSELRMQSLNHNLSWTFDMSYINPNTRGLQPTLESFNRTSINAQSLPPMNQDLLLPGQNEHILLLEGYSISKVSRILNVHAYSVPTWESYLKSWNEREMVGRMVREALDNISSTTNNYLFAKDLIMAMSGTRHVLLPNIVSDDAWVDFAKTFSEFCLNPTALNIERRSTSDSSAPEDLRQYMDSLLASALTIYRYRRLFVTEDERIGLGPGDIQQGDQVTVLFGSQHPVILRRSTKPSDPPLRVPAKASRTFDSIVHRYVGLAFVPSILEEKAVSNVEHVVMQSLQVFCLW